MPNSIGSSLRIPFFRTVVFVALQLIVTNVWANVSSGFRSSSSGSATSDFHIRNGGLVLAGPYFLNFFDRQGLLEKSPEGSWRFKSKAAQQKAARLMRAMAESNSTLGIESGASLENVIVGLNLTDPIPVSEPLTDSEKKAVESLLSAIIGYWTALGNMSHNGLRESFLQREGLLTKDPGNYKLIVQRRAYDVLLEKLPWSISVIRYPWMEKPLYVTW